MVQTLGLKLLGKSTVRSNSALLTDGDSSLLRARYGAAKRER